MVTRALAGPSSRAYCACGAVLRRRGLARSLSTAIGADRVSSIELKRPHLARSLSTDIDVDRIASNDLDFRSVEAELVRRKRKADYKRSKGLPFVDRKVVWVHGGKGGDGCVAFDKQPRLTNFPPSGGNGGRGGSVFVRVRADVDGFARVERNVRGAVGDRGTGAYMHGRAAEDTIVSVPPGTIVRELRDSGPSGRPAWPPEHPDAEARQLLADAAESEDADARETAQESASHLRRQRLFAWHPSLLGDEASPMPHDEAFFEVEAKLLAREDAAHREELKREPLYLDLTDPAAEPVMLIRGGSGGDGNMRFGNTVNKQPKYATRGQAGGSMRLEFELKTLADVGLVGLPNAGKSTFLRAVTNSRAEVASYAFTTLNPQIGTVVFFADGTFGLRETDDGPIEDSAKLPEEFSGRAPSPLLRGARPASEDRREVFRMRIADCPGLLPGAAEFNLGLGHDFLRHIERASVLAYVIDLGSPAPENVLASLRHELEQYRPGLADRAVIVLANQADRVPEAEARDKLDRLREAAGPGLVVVPLSAKGRLNTGKALTLLRTHVERARAEAAAVDARERVAREAKAAEAQAGRLARTIDFERTWRERAIARRAAAAKNTAEPAPEPVVERAEATRWKDVGW